jgi:hypothetical protein
MCGAVLLTAGLVMFTPDSSRAKPGVVKTREGRTIEGDVDERPDSVVVTVRGIATTIARENVDSIEYKGSIEDQYKDKLAKLPQPPAAADHLDLARWLLDNKAYTLAMQEVSAAQRIDPNSSEAATLETTIEGQMRLDRSPKATGTPRTTTTTPPVTGTTGTGTTAAAGKGNGYTAAMHKYISPDDINTMRQMEWPADDNSVRVTFANDVKRRYVARSNANVADFNAMSPVKQAQAILADGTPEERKDVRLLTDPVPLAEYKRSIQATILTNCATSGCHGGPSGGKFFLYGNPEGEAATYTNFYLLTQAVASTNGAEHLMIDRSYPDQSLLALWGLPAQVSKVSHPTVSGIVWHTPYRSTDDPQYKLLIAWINKLVPVNSIGSGLPVPQYGFQSPLPPLPGSEPPPATAPVKQPVRGRAPATRPAARTR